MGRFRRYRLPVMVSALLAARFDAVAQPTGSGHRIGLLLIRSRKHPDADIIE